MSRGKEYRSRIMLKSSGKYAKILENRNAENVILESTAVLGSPKNIRDDEGVYENREVWRANSKLWSLAEAHYNDGRFYWVIGLYNDKPTDAHWAPGDTVYIPQPLHYVISMMEVN